VTRKELTAALVKRELEILTARDLTDLDHVRAMRLLLFRPESEFDLQSAELSSAQQDVLAEAIAAKLPASPTEE